ALHLRACRTPRPRRSAAVRVARPPGRAAARTVGAVQRTRTASRIPRRLLLPSGTRMWSRIRGRTPAAPSSRCRPPRERPARRNARRVPGPIAAPPSRVLRAGPRGGPGALQYGAASRPPVLVVLVPGLILRDTRLSRRPGPRPTYRHGHRWTTTKGS